ncbi:MAG TPA: SDR family oxidoreductase [Bacteroidota bacterium]|nr:SDR family oxidoreductase [Bacteroidota bacterium]
MKNILVTGGTGFIGSNLAIHLTELGYSVRILRRKNSDLRAIQDADVEHRIGNVTDPESLASAMRECDTVFHTAAIVSFWRKMYNLQQQVNVVGTRNVVNACLASGIETLVHTSSVAAIGFTPEGTLASEDTPYNWGGTTGYKYSKFVAEQEVQAGVAKGLRAVIVNPTVVVGERDIHFHGGQLVVDIKRGRVPFFIKGGMNVVYVGDVVKGEIQAALKGRTGERYILGGENLTHKDIFQRTAAIVGGRAPITELPIPILKGAAAAVELVATLINRRPWLTRDLVAGAGRRNWFTTEKAIHELGHTATSFDATIRMAHEWYRDNGFL